MDGTQRQAGNEGVMTHFLKAYKGGRDGKGGEASMCGRVQELYAQENGAIDFLKFAQKINNHADYSKTRQDID